MSERPIANPMGALNERLGTLGTSNVDEFRHLLRRMRKVFPEQAAEASLWYIASHGLNEASRSMSIWLSGDSVYVSVLLDPDGLPAEKALKAIETLKQLDSDFHIKFSKAVTDLSSEQAILRALGLLPGLGDYSLLIPWLRRLAENTDIKVRSRAAKLLCELRPNKGLIQRQMQSSDARVRASAIEALWHSHSENARELFEAALFDPHHRVVANALVGLYQLGETNVFNDMIELCAHKDQLFRAAMAWAIGFVKDVHGIPTLQELSRDKSHMVRKRALNSLLALETLKPIDSIAIEVAETPACEVEATPSPQPALLEELATPTFKTFK